MLGFVTAPPAPLPPRRTACNGPRATIDLPPGLCVRRMHSGAFEVLGLRDPSPEFSTRRQGEVWLATQIAALPARLRPRERTCLSCTTATFTSDGPHHRLCDPCRGRG